MLSLWLFFFLAHHFGMTPDVWWAFPLLISGAICGMVEIVTCVFVVGEFID